jgi:hypothetical protein
MTPVLPGISLAVSLWLLIAQPWAQEPPPDSISSATVFNYGDIDKTCMQWTDGCRNCSRGTERLPLCSNIGIACQPHNEVTCTDRTPEGPR